MKIAGKKSNQVFLNLNLILSSDDTKWSEAVNIFKERFESRFIEPCDKLLSLKEQNLGIGFTVLAIDCLLLETLESFYQGILDSTGKSKKLFQDFLTKKQNFKIFFPHQKLADDFYFNVRCSLLHQAQTAKKVIIRKTGDILSQKGNEIHLNRTKFHVAIKEEFKIYVEKLGNLEEIDLRKNFIKKMKYIADGDLETE